jgi:hypothetical protein
MNKRNLTIAGIMALALAGGSFAAQAQAPAPKTKAERQQANAKWMAAFKAADKNGDGGLSKDELAQVKGFPVIRKNFDAMDTNKDGKVTPEERAAWGKANKQPIK